MKKIFILLLLLSLSLSFTACQKTDNDIISTDAINNIKSNWINYLDVNEAKYSTIVWGAEYLLAFCESPNVDNYRRALAAAETVSATLTKLPVPELTLSKEDVSYALNNGIDISFIEIEFSDLNSDLKKSAMNWENITTDVLTEAFWSYGVEYLVKIAQFQLDLTENYKEYISLTTNYLWLLLGEENYTNNITQSYPCIFENFSEYLASTAEVEEKVNACLDMLEKNINGKSEISSIQKANSDLFSKAQIFENYSEIITLSVDFGKNIFPVFLPQSDAPPSVYTYSTNKKTGEVEWTIAKSNLQDVPNGLVLQYEGMSAIALEQYISLLRQSGYKCIPSDTDSTPYSYECTYVNNYNDFTVKLENDVVTLYITTKEFLPCPYWYFKNIINRN